MDPVGYFSPVGGGTFPGTCGCRDGLQCGPKKIEDVKSWPVPDCLKSVQQFLGFVGYYRRFIPNFAEMAEPLVALTGKDVPFVWRPVCSTATLWYEHRFCRSQWKMETISWIRTPATLAWAESNSEQR